MNDGPDDDGLGLLDIDEELRDLIKPELAAGERLFWAGRSGPMEPIEPRNSRSGDLSPWFVLALALCGVLIACVCGFFHRRSQDPKQSETLLFFTLIASSLSLLAFVGFLAASLSRWQSRRSKQNPVSQRTYAITDRRVIRWDRGVSPEIVEVISIPFSAIKVAELVRYERRDGSGDLLLGGRWDRNASLVSIPEVQRVERLLREHLPRSSWKPRSSDFELDDENLAF